MHTEGRYCAFIDILGFKALFVEPLHTDCDKHKLLLIDYYRKLMDDIYNSIRARNDILQRFGSSEQMTWMAMSDTIVVSCRNFDWLIMCCANIQKYLFAKDLLCRGGIAYGSHWEYWDIKKCYILSKAYTNAYETEQGRDNSKKKHFNNARPRIVLHDSAASLIVERQLYNADNRPTLVKCADGKWMVNPMAYVRDADGAASEIENIAEHLHCGQQNYRDAKKILDKWRWLAAYYRFIILTEGLDVTKHKLWKELNVDYLKRQKFFLPDNHHSVENT